MRQGVRISGQRQDGPYAAVIPAWVAGLAEALPWYVAQARQA